MVKAQAIESHIISLSTAFERDMELMVHEDPQGEEAQRLLKLSSRSADEAKRNRRFDATLKAFFNRYDRNGDGVLDRYELRLLLNDLNENVSEERFEALLAEIDTDGSGVIDFKEFAAAMKEFVRKKNEFHGSGGGDVDLSIQHPSTREKKTEGEGGEKDGGGDDEDDEENDEEEEEVPEDIASLPPHLQRLRILWRSFWMMGLGTLVVLLFSDPMVDVLSGIFFLFSFSLSFFLFLFLSRSFALLICFRIGQSHSRPSLLCRLRIGTHRIKRIGAHRIDKLRSKEDKENHHHLPKRSGGRR